LYGKNYTNYNSIILISSITLIDEKFTCFHANFYTNMFIYYRENTRKPPKASELRHSTSSVCAEIKLCCANPYICEIAFQSLHVHFVHVWVLCFYGSMRRYASHLTNQRVSQHFGSNLNRLTGLAPISEEDQ